MKASNQFYDCRGAKEGTLGLGLLGDNYYLNLNRRLFSTGTGSHDS